MEKEEEKHPLVMIPEGTAEVEPAAEAEPVARADPLGDAESTTEAEPVAGADPQSEMETVSSLHLCTGPGCFKQALADSVYCGTDCILQHAAATMKTLSSPREPKSKGRAQRNPATTRNTAKVSKT